MPIDQIQFVQTALGSTDPNAPELVPFGILAVKSHVRIDLTNDDDYELPAQMAAAVAVIENWTNQKMISQQWDIWWHNEIVTPYGIRLRFPFRPLISVDLVEVEFWNSSPVATLPTDYLVYGDEILLGGGYMTFYPLDPSVNYPSRFVDPSRYHVRATFGYGVDSTSVPPDFIMAALELIANYYDRRTGTAPTGGYRQVLESELTKNGLPQGVRTRLNARRIMAL
jgi:hypothetical protein